MSLAELARNQERLEAKQDTLVPQAVYDRDMEEIRGDIREIKDSLKWGTRYTAGLFVMVILQLGFWIIDNLPPP